MQWFRLYHDLPNDRKLRKFSSQQKWAWVVLLCMASESGDRGYIRDIDDEDTADCCGFESTQDYLFFIDKLRQKGMAEPIEGGLKITNWEERQYTCPSSSKEATRDRKRKQRAKQKSLANADTEESSAVEEENGHGVTSRDIAGHHDNRSEIRDQIQRSDPEREEKKEKSDREKVLSSPSGIEPEKSTTPSEAQVSFSDFPESGRNSDAQNFNERFEKPQFRKSAFPWLEKGGSYVDGFVMYLAEAWYKKHPQGDRRIKAVDGIRWASSQRAKPEDKAAMNEAWKCYELDLEAKDRAAEAEVVRLVDFGKTKGNPFWTTTYGEVLGLKLSKFLEYKKAKTVEVIGISQNAEAYRVQYLKDGIEADEQMRKDAVIPNPRRNAA
jgi:hypothetical protein